MRHPLRPLVLALGLALLLATPAAAEPPKPTPAKADTPAKASKDDAAPMEVSRTADGRLRLKMKKPEVVVGQVQRPRAYYLLERQRRLYRPLTADKALRPKILASVSRLP